MRVMAQVKNSELNVKIVLPNIPVNKIIIFFLGGDRFVDGLYTHKPYKW